MKEVPIQGLPISFKTRHQLLLNFDARDMVFGAEENLRGTFKIPRCIIRMARP